MDYDIRSENKLLRSQLRDFLAEARHNEEKMRRFDEQEHRLIASRSLEELVRITVHDYRAVSDLDLITLTLVDPEYELARMLENAGQPSEQDSGLIFLDNTKPLVAVYGEAPAPILGAYRHQQQAALFKHPRLIPASVALLPLVRQDKLIGSLNLGSLKLNRFAHDDGTYFLERLATILAICLENAANHERLKLIGLTDPLTGISNRRYFEQRYGEALCYAQRHADPLAFMFMDVDRFKAINDTYGHQAGDMVLRGVASTVKARLRACDLLARYGGEEFVVLLPKTREEHALEVAERIRSDIANQAFQLPNGEILQVTISIGIANLDIATPSQEIKSLGEALIAEADTALFRAKNGGRNQVACASTEKPIQPENRADRC